MVVGWLFQQKNHPMRLPVYLTACFGLFCLNVVMSQRFSAELMAGNRNYWYQHTLNQAIGDSTKWQFFHTSSFNVFYAPTEFEVMSQSFVNYQLTRRWKAGIGTFFTTAAGFNPSFSMQYAMKTPRLLIVISPRTDLRKSPNGELMFLFEWRSKRLYFRFQLMENMGAKGHNRSYQLLRFGWRMNYLMIGPSINVDYYGGDFTSYANAGVFLRLEAQ